MVLSESNTTNSPEKIRNESKPDKKGEKPMTKIIVRRLPPSMTQEEFLNQVSPIPDFDYMYIIKGDMALGEHAFSRVYVNFCNAEDVYMFKEKFDNYVFVDNKGHEYAAVVEYSAFQKIPKRRKPRPDPKMGTIETDPVYLEFLESLKEQPNQEEKPEYSYVINSSAETKNDGTTPLLDFLKQRKQERNRIREEKRRKEIERKKQKRLEEKKLKSSVLKDVKKEEKEERKEVVASGSEVGFEVKKPSEKVVEKGPKSKNKFEDRKSSKSGRFASNKYEERKDFKNRRDEYRDSYHSKKHEEKKTDSVPAKKVKKYSEKREERKNNEAFKEEAKREMESKKSNDEKEDGIKEATKSTDKESFHCDRSEEAVGHHKHKNKENDPRIQRRIRNKDRPTMAIYKPGMLRKKSTDQESDEKEDCGKTDKD